MIEGDGDNDDDDDSSDDDNNNHDDSIFIALIYVTILQESSLGILLWHRYVKSFRDLVHPSHFRFDCSNLL